MLNLLAFIFFSTFSSNINNYLKREMALKFCTTVFSLVCKHFPIEKTKIFNFDSTSCNDSLCIFTLMRCMIVSGVRCLRCRMSRLCLSRLRRTSFYYRFIWFLISFHDSRRRWLWMIIQCNWFRYSYNIIKHIKIFIAIKNKILFTLLHLHFVRHGQVSHIFRLEFSKHKQGGFSSTTFLSVISFTC